MDTPDSYGVFGGRDEQWLVAEVAVETPEGLDAPELVVETGEESHDTTVDVGEVTGRLASFGEAYGGGDGTGWVAARLPNPLDAEEAVLAWNGGDHPLDESVLETLNRPPTDFDVVLGAPQVASVGDEVTATVSVVNTGDVEGTFVAALNRVGPRVAYAPETAVVLPLEAGEYTEWEHTYGLNDPEVAEMDDPMLRFHLPWRDGRRTREVTVATQ